MSCYLLWYMMEQVQPKLTLQSTTWPVIRISPMVADADVLDQNEEVEEQLGQSHVLLEFMAR